MHDGKRHYIISIMWCELKKYGGIYQLKVTAILLSLSTILMIFCTLIHAINQRKYTWHFLIRHFILSLSQAPFPVQAHTHPSQVHQQAQE